MSSLSAEVIARAESFPGIKAGIAPLKDILNSPSYGAVPEEDLAPRIPENERGEPVWPTAAKSVLVLGLHHPKENPRLDWWDRGNTMGNRLLIKLSNVLKNWLYKKHQVRSIPLPYHQESGGLFLKDAAILAGLGIIGRNNLLLTPEWGPRLRLRAILIIEELAPTSPIEGFVPCASCTAPCHSICPQNVFSTGTYLSLSCIKQFSADRANKIPFKPPESDEPARLIARHCRACEFACPVGT